MATPFSKLSNTMSGAVKKHRDEEEMETSAEGSATQAARLVKDPNRPDSVRQIEKVARTARQIKTDARNAQLQMEAQARHRRKKENEVGSRTRLGRLIVGARDRVERENK